MNLVIVNPHAQGGRAEEIWPHLEPVLIEHFDDLIIAITRRIDEVAIHIDKALEIGVERVLIVGGDGTSHTIINALLHNTCAPDIAIGQIPVGTGRDWARTLSIPRNPVKAIEWLATAQPTACDIGQVTLGNRERLFLNIASAGVGAQVTQRVNRITRRRPWTFLLSIVIELLRYQPDEVRIHLDGEPFYQGSSYVTAIANGRWFGHGIMAAPAALPDDGLFDVLLIEGMSRLRIIRRLIQAFKGEHVHQPDVHSRRARQVDIIPVAAAELGMELDGEPDIGTKLHFEILPSAIKILSHQAS